MSHPLFNLKGRVAVVTGSSKGLGRSMAFALGEAGARVCLNYNHDEKSARATRDAFHGHGLDGIMVRASAIDPEGVDELISSCEEKLGPPDILVVNATCDQPHSPIEEYGWDFYQAMLDFFIKSPYLLTRRALPHLKDQRWGRIINIGSEVFQRGVGNFSAYVAAKGGQNGWSRSMASELAPWNITVNMMSPGWIPVERHANDPQEEKDGYRALIPMNRWGVPDDIKGTLVYLASEASGFVTGQNICVNGGMTVA
jgi:3-oxoacyl-[acyl-carrier protein] reductase